MEILVSSIEGFPALAVIILLILLALAFLTIIAVSFVLLFGLIFLELREMILGVQDLSQWLKRRRRPAETLPCAPYGSQGAGGTDVSSRP